VSRRHRQITWLWSFTELGSGVVRGRLGRVRRSTFGRVLAGRGDSFRTIVSRFDGGSTLFGLAVEVVVVVVVCGGGGGDRGVVVVVDVVDERVVLCGSLIRFRLSVRERSCQPVRTVLVSSRRLFVQIVHQLAQISFAGHVLFQFVELRGRIGRQDTASRSSTAAERVDCRRNDRSRMSDQKLSMHCAAMISTSNGRMRKEERERERAREQARSVIKVSFEVLGLEIEIRKNKKRE
jgi:hypothetical protein